MPIHIAINENNNEAGIYDFGLSLGLQPNLPHHRFIGEFDTVKDAVGHLPKGVKYQGREIKGMIISVSGNMSPLLKSVELLRTKLQKLDYIVSINDVYKSGSNPNESQVSYIHFIAEKAQQKIELTIYANGCGRVLGWSYIKKHILQAVKQGKSFDISDIEKSLQH